MPLAAAAIMPHGFSLIPELTDGLAGSLAVTAAMEEIGRRFLAAGVDVVVVVGPHGTRVAGAMCVMDVGRAAGTLSQGKRLVEMNVPCDPALIENILRASRSAGIPVAAAGFGGNRAEQSVAPLDWGALVPLWFVGHDENRSGSGSVLSPSPDKDSGPPVVLITPARTLSRESMIAFGQMLAGVFAADVRRIGFIASCDWAHTHTKEGPYGSHPKAREVDARVVEAVTANDLHSLASLSEEDVAASAIDGLWQALILAGVQDFTPCEVDLLSYEVPSYFGMIVAAFMPEVDVDGRR